MFSGAQQPQRPRGPQPGTDLEYQATVDFWTAIRGGQARLDVHRQEVCPTCHGQASSGGLTQCPECNGTGHVTQMGGRMKLSTFPAAVANGTGHTANVCATCRGEGLVSRSEAVEFRIKAGTRTASGFACKVKVTPGRTAARPATCFSLSAPARIGLHALGDDIHLTVSGNRARGFVGSKGGRSHHRRAVRSEDSSARRRAKAAHGESEAWRTRSTPASAADQIVTVEVMVPTLADERSRESCASWPG